MSNEQRNELQRMMGRAKRRARIMQQQMNDVAPDVAAILADRIAIDNQIAIALHRIATGE